MATVFHAGFKTYLLTVLLGYIALCFVAPDIAHEILRNLHYLAVAIKP